MWNRIVTIEYKPKRVRNPFIGVAKSSFGEQELLVEFIEGKMRTYREEATTYEKNWYSKKVKLKRLRQRCH